MLLREETAARACSSRAFSGGIGGDALIRTPCGERRAEMVRPGDLIVTRFNGLQPVRMIWRKRLTRADLEPGSTRAPIRLRPRAVGPMMPVRDLLVAADHRIVVPSYRLTGAPESGACLVPARVLADGSDGAYADRSTTGVDLYTFIFDSHQVFCASGLPVESFLPSPSSIASLTGRLRKELTALFPVLRSDPAAYPPARIPEAPRGVCLAESA